MNPALLFFAMFDVGGPEVLVIMFIILLLFGGERLPELAKGLGKSIREFKKAASNVEDELKRAIEDAPTPPRPFPKLLKPSSPAVTPVPASSETPPSESPPGVPPSSQSTPSEPTSGGPPAVEPLPPEPDPHP